MYCKHKDRIKSIEKIDIFNTKNISTLSDTAIFQINSLKKIKKVSNFHKYNLIEKTSQDITNLLEKRKQELQLRKNVT